MLRGQIEDGLKDALRARDPGATSTLRLILAAIKDRDIAERGKGNPAGLSDDQIRALLRSMIKQRHESIRLYEQGNRSDLAQQEAQEIVVIERFLPPQLSDEAVTEAVEAVVAELEAKTLKDMGRVIAVLKERYAGQIDFAKAGAVVKQRLT